MKKLSLVLALALITPFGGMLAEAQSAPKLVPPQGPLIAGAPDHSQWVITFSYPQDRVKGDVKGFTETRTRTITTTKTGNLMQEEDVGARGDKYDIWHIGHDVYEKWPSSATWVQDPPKAVAPSGFRDVGWVARDNYAGTLQYANRQCFVFVQGAPAGFNVGSPDFQIEQLDQFHNVAFIDATSRLPVETRAFGVYCSYSFADALTDKLTLPADLVAQLKHDQAILSRLGGRPSP